MLAVSVIDGIDAISGDDGVQLPTDDSTSLLDWTEIDQAVGDVDPDSDEGRRRLREWFRLRMRLSAMPDLAQRLRVVGLPKGHLLHPGAEWVRQHVPGGTLDMGLGVLGAADDPDEVVITPPGVLVACEVDIVGAWGDVVHDLEQRGRLAAQRFIGDPRGPLRPFGDFDVVTLLASEGFRAELCAADPLGWRTAAVPMRQRGWLDLGRIDPAFAAAAARATEPAERGFDRALLVTPEEVVLAATEGNSAAHALQDPPASIDPWLRRT